MAPLHLYCVLLVFDCDDITDDTDHITIISQGSDDFNNTSSIRSVSDDFNNSTDASINATNVSRNIVSIKFNTTKPEH